MNTLCIDILMYNLFVVFFCRSLKGVTTNRLTKLEEEVQRDGLVLRN